MKKILLFILIIVIILIVGILVWKKLTRLRHGFGGQVKKEISMPETLKNKKIVMIIAFRDFRDEEYFIPKQILQEAGAEIITASSASGTAIGSQGGEANIDILINEVKVGDYDAVLFVGGSGASKYIDDEDCHRIANQTLEQNKVLGAICIAPAILARAGVLNGKKATVWSSTLDKSAVKILKESGAIFQSEAVVTDGKIVTAWGPSAAKEFAQAIIALLSR